MKVKTFLPAWLLTFIVMFGLNGLFHMVAAASFFDESLAPMSGCIRKLKDSAPLPVALLDFLLVFIMTYFIARQSTPVRFREAALAGALVNLASAGAWNLANRAMMMEWPGKMMIADMAWHVLLGAGAGMLIAVILNWRSRAAASK